MRIVRAELHCGNSVLCIHPDAKLYKPAPRMMTLDLTADNPQWGITPAAERMEDAQGEHRSLQEKYGKK